ncbi:MAG TPA: glycosyltransferase, partial [Conexibacter sp.]|nr:glycosyltransferase [Conexibacter sp.]
MRVALVSPYSWTYPGGVTRHIEALAERFIAEGHEVRVLAPYDPDDRLSSLLHRGATPQRRPLPEYLIPLGRTMGFKANGAVSNLSARTAGVSQMRRELRAGGFDVVHLHEPVVPMLCWDACVSTRLPLVATFHAYSTNRLTNNLANVLGARRLFNHL